MAPFLRPQNILNSLKEKIEAIHVQGDRIYLGTALGNLSIYDLHDGEAGTEDTTLVSTKSLGKRSIEQLGYIKDLNSLAVLSDSIVTLYPMPDLVPPTPLTQTRKAFSFAVNSTVENVSADGKIQSFDDVASSQSAGVPTVITYLVVGSQRKLVVYCWKDGEAEPEAPLPHSARVIAFVRPTVLCLAYSASEHVLFYLNTMTTGEITMPVSVPSTTSTGAYGMNALSGLGGYMSLGLAAKAKAIAVAVGENVLIPKDNTALFFGPDGKASGNALLWPAPPEDVVFMKPYLASIQSAGTIPETAIPELLPPSSVSNGIVSVPTLSFQSSLTFQPVQNIALSVESQYPYSLRLLSTSPGNKAPLFVVSTPSERATAATQGSSLWKISMRNWSDQIDELVEDEKYSDALSLLESLDDTTSPGQAAKKAKICTLLAVAQFKVNEFDDAMDAFMELNVNPAKVISLYPESISGRLHIAPDECIPMFGGPKPKRPKEKEEEKRGGLRRSSVHEPSTSVGRSPSPSGSLRNVLPIRRSTLNALLPTSMSSTLEESKDKEDDSASIRGRAISQAVGQKKGKARDMFPRSVEILLRYLTEMRRRINNQVEALKISPGQAHQFPFLSETSVEELFALPSVPLPSLTPEQLTRFAQIVDTALFKAYLIIRPGLLGPLCGLPNWCEVQEVEEVLMEKEKFNELVALYRGRKMHAKALALLRKLSETEIDVEEKIRPSVAYTKNLGEENLEQIFSAVRWMHHFDSSAAFDIFTAEMHDLPRSKVADFLEDELSPSLCAQYLEYLIHERDETSTLFHDRLAELYLDMATNAKKRRDEGTYEDVYHKFLEFIQTSDIYRVDRLFGLLPSDDMFEARAVLLGRMGKHINALEVYVYRIGDFIKAEEYCKSIHMPSSPTKDIFLSLLRIYLEPSSSAYQKGEQPKFHQAALDLIARQSTHLDTLETLRLLPPLVPAQDICTFLRDAARASVFDTRIVREVRKARSAHVSRKLMQLESHRVRITDSRMCPQCHKRLGTSVIAIHAPRGEVTHYQCREAFANARKRNAESKPSTRIDMSSRYI